MQWGRHPNAAARRPFAPSARGLLIFRAAITRHLLSHRAALDCSPESKPLPEQHGAMAGHMPGNCR